MDTLIHADIFFFITSIAVILGTIVFIVAAFYIIPVLKNLRDISETLKRGVEKAEESLDQAYEAFEENPVIRFLSGFARSKKKARKQSL